MWTSLRDLKALTAASRDFSDLGRTPVAAILFGIARLEADPALFDALQRRSFIEKGLELADGPECPLCDHPWDNIEHHGITSKRSSPNRRKQAVYMKRS